MRIAALAAQGLAALAAVLAGVTSAEARVTRYRIGNPADVNPPLFGPVHDFGGGGSDVGTAIQWMIDAARGCTDCAAKLDVLVLRSTGSDGYNDYIYAMNGVDSVETLVITTPSDSNRPNVQAAVQGAEVVFFAGGDQCDYVRNFKGTLVESAVELVFARGGGVAGTSAGLAIQGEYVYDACNGSVTSSQALANPYHPRISFSYDFFSWSHLERAIADTHFVTRNRMGRVLAFLARQLQDGLSPDALAVAVNEATSVVVERTGLATVMGAGPAYFVLADHLPEVCAPATPLTYSDFKIWKVPAGGTFDLADRPALGYYLRSVTDGVLSANPY
jgi:cyanophycinase-like exopeptidase